MLTFYLSENNLTINCPACIFENSHSSVCFQEEISMPKSFYIVGEL